ncbi:MAG: aminotransferase class I/II-fold pyridoxal phosphate-dependent enzyme, partial [Desulfovibrionaceae bacterium]|nr:aminotransferase class I/II-fold pyridoxal phosphate-dependent enzyme [Desulfovibrionaceae bacterium]
MTMPLTGPDSVRPEVEAFTPYTPGLSIDEIQERYGLSQVIKMASNENPLGASPQVRAAIERHAAKAFRYPQSGNPRLVAALARHHGVEPARVVVGNGSDELIDLLIRARAVPGRHNVVAFAPCFSIYALQSRFCGVELRQTNLKEDFSFDCDALLRLVDVETALVFVT